MDAEAELPDSSRPWGSRNARTWEHILHQKSLPSAESFFLLYALPALVHLLIVGLVVPTSHFVQPFLVFKIPLYGLLDAFLELK